MPWLLVADGAARQGGQWRILINDTIVGLLHLQAVPALIFCTS
jgi:hypothetical protein